MFLCEYNNFYFTVNPEILSSRIILSKKVRMEGLDLNVKKELVETILIKEQYYSLPDSFLNLVMTEVGLEGHFDMDAFIEHVVGIYDSYKQHYQHYLNQKSFQSRGGVRGVGNFVRKIFKKYEQKCFEKLNKGQYSNNYVKKTPMEDPLNMPSSLPRFPPMPMNINMAQLSNMGPDQIQAFQKKMYQLCCNNIPQIMDSVRMKSQMGYPYKPEWMDGFQRMMAMNHAPMGQIPPNNMNNMMKYPMQNMNKPKFMENKPFPNNQYNNYRSVPPPMFPQQTEEKQHHRTFKSAFSHVQPYEQPRKKVKIDEQQISLLKNINMFHEIIETINVRKVQPEENKYIFDEKTIKKFQQNKSHDIDIRCVDVKAKQTDEINWPGKIKISLSSANSSLSDNFYLSSSISLRKIIETKNFGSCPKQITLSFPQLSEQTSLKSEFLIGVFLIRELSLQQVEKKLLPTFKKITMEEQLEKSGEESIRIELLEGKKRQYIKIPVKGFECLHAQCFDFRNFLSEVRKTGKWKCPICGKIVKKCFYLNECIQEEISNITKGKKLEETNAITFSTGGFVEYQEEEDKKPSK